MWYINYKTNEGVTTMRKELLKGLTDEQIKKLENCKDSEEILALAKEEGVTLTDEQLEAVSGGGCIISTAKCDKCGSKNVKLIRSVERGKYECEDCGNVFHRKNF